MILRAVFGTHAGAREDELSRRIDDVLVRTTRTRTQIAVLLAEAASVPRTPFHRAIRRMDNVLRDEIRERQRASDLDERDDILSMLVQARDEDGAPLDEDELRDQLVTLLLAGHETTATALAWAFDALFRNPEVRSKLKASLADGDDYLDAAVEESLRIRPTVHDVGRRLGEALEAKDGRTIEAGAAVFASVDLLHRREDLFPEPLAFRPERFLGDERPSTYAGSRSAAACGAASAPRSRSSRCAACCAQSSRTPTYARRPDARSRSSAVRSRSAAKRHAGNPGGAALALVRRPRTSSATRMVRPRDGEGSATRCQRQRVRRPIDAAA